MLFEIGCDDGGSTLGIGMGFTGSVLPLRLPTGEYLVRETITVVSNTTHGLNTHFNVLGESEEVVEQAQSGAEVREGQDRARDMALNAAPDDLLDLLLLSL